MIKKKISNLKDWVEENYKILSIMGIFAALIGFFNNLYNIYKIESLNYLSFISFSIFFLFCIEIWISFPRRDEHITKRLLILETLFVFFFFSVIILLLELYKNLIINYLFFVFIPIYAVIVVKFIEKTKIHLHIREMRNKKSESLLSYFVAGFVFLLIIVLSFITQNIAIFILNYLHFI